MSVHLRNVRHRSGRPRFRAALLPPQRSTIRQSELELFASGAQGRQLVCAWPSHPGESATSLLPYVPYGSMFASFRAIHVTQQHAIRTNFVGCACSRRSLRFAWLKKKGMKWNGWHAFHRGLATNLHDMGVPTKVIQRICRHADEATTKKHYIHATEPGVRRGMRKLEASITREKYERRRKHLS